MSVFREGELSYMAGGRQLGRIATVGADGTPHVVPVGWIYNAARDAIDIGGHELDRTKKFRDVARTGGAATGGTNSATSHEPAALRSLSTTWPARTRGTRVGSRSAGGARRSRCRRR